MTETQTSTKRKIEWTTLFSIMGVLGTLFFALKMMLEGYVSVLISDTGFITLLLLGKVDKNQAIFWIGCTIITIGGFINWIVLA